jgi:hypothetical protein
MPTNGTPPVEWPIEPTTLYSVSYYPNSGTNQGPTNVEPNLRSINDATARAKQLITNAGNVGVCIIQPITAVIVYPAIPWKDF